MFIVHYNDTYIKCNIKQLDLLSNITQIIFKSFNKDYNQQIINNILYQNDDIFYLTKYLFKSEKPLYYLYKNYCNLAKLIYLKYYPNTDINILDNKIFNILEGEELCL